MKCARRAFLRRSAIVGSGALAAGCLSLGEPPEAQVRAAAEAFDGLRDLDTALDDGYRSAATYVRTDAGGLGEVFVDGTRSIDLEPDDLDPERPQRLYYGLSEEGAYHPAGVGWAVSTDVTSSPPRLFGTEFGEATPGRFSGQPGHYELNAWVFEDHPDGVFAPLHPDLTGPTFVEELSVARDALARYRQSDTAMDDGYENTETHVFDEAGLYGVPFVDPDAEGLDIERPPILLYRITDQWYYELLGAEWFVPADEYDDPPELLGQPFHEPMQGHSSKTDQPEHYGLHAWLFRTNPAGMFAPYNARLE